MDRDEPAFEARQAPQRLLGGGLGELVEVAVAREPAHLAVDEVEHLGGADPRRLRPDARDAAAGNAVDAFAACGPGGESPGEGGAVVQAVHHEPSSFPILPI